ncbi:hypothetical protein I4U23_004657 [Adineta vaga]|nr:hypothetical protein I4U23_004657 [Adineta vaga]
MVLINLTTLSVSIRAPIPCSVYSDHPPIDLLMTNISSIARDLSNCRYSSTDLVRWYLARIDAVNRQGSFPLHAVIETNPDALTIAESLDRERQITGRRSPIHGIPILIKDSITTDDQMQTTAGSLALIGARLGRDAHVVQQLRQAGAVILGKASLTEWSDMRLDEVSGSGWSARGGLARSAYVANGDPLGSSSGSAIAVSAGLCAGALGEETAGSIVAPSSVASIVGLKPTVGLVSRSGVIPISRYHDSVGPMCQTVEDVALMLEIIQGIDELDNFTQKDGFVRSKNYTQFLRGIDGLQDLRLGVVRFGENHADEEFHPQFAPNQGYFEKIANESKLSLLDQQNLLNRTRQWGGESGIDATLRQHHLDALIMADFNDIFIMMASAVGYPLISVSLSYRQQDGQPYGLIIAGTSWSEPTLLRVAHGFEQASHVRQQLLLGAVFVTGDRLSAPHDVRIDYYKAETTKDLVINTGRPHFSWKLPLTNQRNVQQTAYQIQIRSMTTILWDSGRLMSSQSVHVPYPYEKDLEELTHYQIRFCIWTTASKEATPWTSWIPFRTSLYNFHQYLIDHKDEVNWIGSTQIYMNELRKEFNVSNTSPIRSATVSISGIGYYEMYLNGDRIDSSRKLDPGWTTYQKRTFFASYDVSFKIKVGMNAVGVKLGNGWYSQEQYLLPAIPEFKYGPPRLMFVLHIIFENSEQMNVSSDQTWRGRQGSIIHDSVYNGEFVDARYDRPEWAQVGFNDSLSLWITPEILPSPVNITSGGQLTLQDMPPVRAGPDALHFEVEYDVDEKKSYLSKEESGTILGASLKDGGILKPISMSLPFPTVQIFDMGQNMAGWCRFKLHGPRGVGIYIRHAEVLEQAVVSTGKSENLPYTHNLRGATQTDTYVLRGDPNGEIYEPRETTLKGHFSSSNQVINQIQHNILWGLLSNSMSLPTDCPQRDERKGWMGDAALSVNVALYNFDFIKFYLNFLTLIMDIQLKGGFVPDTVPLSFGIYPADPSWGTALPTITWQLYRHYNDTQILRDHYASTRAYVESIHLGYRLTGLAELIYHYGDWVPPPPQPKTNGHLVASFAFLHDVSLLINMSQILGYSNDTRAYTAFYQKLAEEFHQVFFKTSAGYYADGMQAAQILALALPNVVPANVRNSVVQHLVEDIRVKGNHVTTGIVSTAQLYPLLSDNGYHDLAVEMISSITYPSYGFMFSNPYENATTLWELWDAPFEGANMNSRNHHMFASVGAWFYSHLAGIDLQSDLIVIRPRLVSEEKKHLLSKIDCQLSTLYGLIHLSYTRDEHDTFANSILLRVTIPTNAQAKLVFEPLFPGAKCVNITEGGEMIWPVADKRNQIIEDLQTGLMTVHIGSGSYEYQVVWK